MGTLNLEPRLSYKGTLCPNKQATERHHAAARCHRYWVLKLDVCRDEADGALNMCPLYARWTSAQTRKIERLQKLLRHTCNMIYDSPALCS